jgi:hypothetical protein
MVYPGLKSLVRLIKLASKKEDKTFFAPGIPFNKTQSVIRKIETPENFEYVLHKHDAIRAQTHYDLRLGDPKNKKGLSWVLKNGLPKNPGDRVLAIRTVDHVIPYFDFSGKIKSGYGAGKVDIADRAKVEVLESRPDFVRFTTLHNKFPREYFLKQLNGKEWVMMDNTPSFEKKAIPNSKQTYKSTDIKKIDPSNKDQWFTGKMDGALSILNIRPNKHLELWGYRKEKNSPALITYSAKVPQISHQRAPGDLNDTQVRGELVVLKNGKLIPLEQISGLLNTSPEKSRLKQEQGNLEFNYYMFDVLRYNGKKLNNIPYAQKYEILKGLNKKLNNKNIKIVPVAKNTESKKRMIKAILNKKHPLTSEGVVIQNSINSKETPIKAKVTETYDCIIEGVADGFGKYKNKGIGAFVCRMPNGKRTFNVGSGLNDQLRKQAFKNPKQYIGKVIEVSATGEFKDNTLRNPVFFRVHGDKNE